MKKSFIPKIVHIHFHNPFPHQNHFENNTRIFTTLANDTKP